jgi:hypothetical protein
MSVLRGTKSLACPGRHIIGLPGAPKSSICGWSCVSHILCCGYYRPLKSEVRFLKNMPIYSTSSLHRHKEQHGTGVWPLLEPNFIAVNRGDYRCSIRNCIYCQLQHYGLHILPVAALGTAHTASCSIRDCTYCQLQN